MSLSRSRLVAVWLIVIAALAARSCCRGGRLERQKDHRNGADA